MKLYILSNKSNVDPRWLAGVYLFLRDGQKIDFRRTTAT